MNLLEGLNDKQYEAVINTEGPNLIIAGAGSLTTVLSLRAEYAIENIIVAILLNMVVIFLVLYKIEWFEKLLGKGGIFILRKFFGIILLAISIKLFSTNIVTLF